MKNKQHDGGAREATASGAIADQKINLKEHHDDLLRRLTRLSRFGWALQVIEVIKWKNPKADLSKAIQDAVAKGVDLDLREDELTRLIREHIDTSAADDEARVKSMKRASKRGSGPPRLKRPADTALTKELSRARGTVHDELAKVPASLEKAESALIVGLDATVSENHGHASVLTYLGVERRREFAPYVATLRDQLLTCEWPIPHASQYDTQSSELAKYYELFEPDSSKDYLRTLASELSSELVAEIPTHSRSSENLPYPHLASTAMRLWLLGRAVTLRFLLSDPASNFIRFAAQWQEPSGAWLQGKKGGEVADPWTTALIVHAMCRWRRGAHQAAIARAADWLLHNTNSDGGWRAASGHGTGSMHVVATIVALDALRRGSVPADHPVIRAAEDALLAAQHSSGLWIEQGFPEDLLTVIALEYFRSRAHRGALSNRYLRSANLLLDSAGQMALTGDKADEQLACIAAYHGLEHFLYGLMLLHGEEDAIYAAGGQQTVGLRQALSPFEQLAQQAGWLEAGKRLPYRQQLSDLAALRDSFIHRAGEIPRDEMEGHIRVVQRFVAAFDVQALGFPLQD